MAAMVITTTTATSATAIDDDNSAIIPLSSVKILIWMSNTISVHVSMA